MLKLRYAYPVLGAVACAVEEEHVRPLRPLAAHAFEVRVYEIAGVFKVFINDAAHLVCPLHAFRTESADERVHGQDVALVVVAHIPAADDAVTQVFVVYDMVRADEPGQREGLARRVEGDDAVFRILGDGLRRDMLVPGHDDVRPYLVGDNDAVIRGVDLHRLFYLPALPYSAAGVVRRAEDSEVNVVLLYLPIHVLIVHAPDALFVALELAVDYDAPRVVHRVREADVGGGVDEYLVPGRGEALHCRAHAAKHAVFVADVLREQPLDAVARALPVYDAVKVFVRQGEVAEVRHLHALEYRLHGRRRGDKAHVRDPHRYRVKALVGLNACEGYLVKGQGVPAVPVEHCCKIVFHF